MPADAIDEKFSKPERKIDFQHTRISDPVHGTIGLSELETRVINTRAFQRLRHVKHLGLDYLVFPAADFSRFSHCIGVTHVTGKVLKALRRSPSGPGIPDSELQQYRLAGLLHDLGHYPFSHAMEDAVERHYGVLAGPLGHEELGQEVLEHDPEMKDILEGAGYSPPSIYSIFRHLDEKLKYSNLVSSDLDADRIDYLLRTALHTGLPYGSVDLNYLISQFRLDDKQRICITHKALRAADHFLLCRYFDNLQVAFHKSVCACELVLKDVIQELLARGLLNCSAERMRARIAAGEWASFDDVYVTTLIRQLREIKDPILELKTRAILDRQPPKLIGHFEQMMPTDHAKQGFQFAKKSAEDVRTEFSKKFDVAPGLLYTWAKKRGITAVGGSVAASSALEEQGRDQLEQEFSQAIRVLDRGTRKSRPIMEIKSSLMSVLATQSLFSIRLYALLVPGDTRRDEMRVWLQKQMPGFGWE